MAPEDQHRQRHTKHHASQIRRAASHRKNRSAKPAKTLRRDGPAAADLDATAQARFALLKAWRAEVARTHNLPAYVIFHDATLVAIAQSAPRTLEDLHGISGMGSRKLQAYGADVLHVIEDT